MIGLIDLEAPIVEWRAPLETLASFGGSPKSASRAGFGESGRLDLNQRPLGPQPTSVTCRSVAPRPSRPQRPSLWTMWTHETQQSVLRRYHGT